MAFYEHVIIARQDISAAQVEALTADFSKIIEDNGGTVAKNEYWGLKSLAYKIKKNRKGHYVLLNLDAPHAAVFEMERLERLNEDILRTMTIRVDELEEGESVVVRQRSEKSRPRDRDRGDRGDRGPREKTFDNKKSFDNKGEK